MPKKLKLIGTVVSDNTSRVYDYFGLANISPSKVMNFLNEANGDDIEITINSGGGDVSAGADIFTDLKSYSGNSTANIVFAASAASVFAMGAKKVLMSPAGQMMIHNSSTIAWGDRNTMDGKSNMLRSVDESIANAYVSKTGMSRDELLALMDKETWMDAVKAKELGFIDDVMFAEATPLLSNNFATGGEMLPQEVIDKVLNELQGIENEPPVTNSVQREPITPQSNKNKEEPTIMDMNELKEKHPELYAQITEQVSNDTQTAERKRIADLQAFASAPGAAELINEAITNGGTVQDVALKVMEASMKRNGKEATNRALDAKDSGVDDVETIEAKTPDAIKDEKKADTVASMVAMAQKMKSGGRK